MARFKIAAAGAGARGAAAGAEGGARAATRREPEARMKAIFSPAVSILIGLSNQRKLPLLAVLFMAPLALLFYETREYVSSATALWVAGTLVLALYALASHYIQADVGWQLLIVVFTAARRGRPHARSVKDGASSAVGFGHGAAHPAGR